MTFNIKVLQLQEFSVSGSFFSDYDVISTYISIYVIYFNGIRPMWSSLGYFGCIMTTQHLLKAIQWLKKDMNRIFQIILQDRNNPPHERSISLHMYVYEIEGNACSLSEKKISWRKDKQ